MTAGSWASYLTKQRGLCQEAASKIQLVMSRIDLCRKGQWRELRCGTDRLSHSINGNEPPCKPDQCVCSNLLYKMQSPAGQLANSGWWARQGSVFPTVPSEAALQDVLRDLFGAISLPASLSGTGAAPADLAQGDDPWGFACGLPKCAPASSLAARCDLTLSQPLASHVTVNRMTQSAPEKVEQHARALNAVSSW